MKPARILTAVLIAVATGLISWILLDSWTSSGGNPPPLPWATVLAIGALVAVVLAAGWPVRRWLHGRKDKPIDPLVAARTAVLARAAAYGGAVLTGWYVGQAVDVLPDLVGVRRDRFVIALVAGAVAIGLSAAGFVVQHWCRIPPEDDDSFDPRDDDRNSVR